MKRMKEALMSYSEVVGAVLRQERRSDHPAYPESVVEQMVRQLTQNRTIEHLELDLSALVDCPECEPGEPCEGCATEQHEVDRQLREHLRRVKAAGRDPLDYLLEVDRFHDAWQQRFEHLHLAAMGGESTS